MITSVELLKLDVYKGFREKVKGIDTKREWKHFKKLIHSEINKDIIEKIDLKEEEKVRVTISGEEKTSRGLSKVLEKYIIKSDIDLTKMLVEERR